MSKQTPTDKILATIEAGRDVTEALMSTLPRLPEQTKHEIAALATRIRLCNNKQNHWVVNDAWSEQTGECYDAVGQFWECGSKLCSGCLRQHARRSRKRVREALDRQQLGRGERYHFITFTIPNPSRSLVATRKIVDRAWTLFRKRKIVCDLIRGGVKSEEFTLTDRGYHYHLHCIVKSLYLHYRLIRRVWTECVDKAFDEAGIAYLPNTSDGYLIVNIQNLYNQEKAVHEVCKYITKSDSWTKMRRDDLVDVAMIRRWPRMLEFFGSFRNLKKGEAIVHTSDVSDGDASNESNYWRDVVERIGAKAYHDVLLDEFERSRKVRIEQLKYRWPGTSIVTADKFTSA